MVDSKLSLDELVFRDGALYRLKSYNYVDVSPVGTAIIELPGFLYNDCDGNLVGRFKDRDYSARNKGALKKALKRYITQFAPSEENSPTVDAFSWDLPGVNCTRGFTHYTMLPVQFYQYIGSPNPDK